MSVMTFLTWRTTAIAALTEPVRLPCPFTRNVRPLRTRTRTPETCWLLATAASLIASRLWTGSVSSVVAV